MQSSWQGLCARVGGAASMEARQTVMILYPHPHHTLNARCHMYPHIQLTFVFARIHLDAASLHVQGIPGAMDAGKGKGYSFGIKEKTIAPNSIVSVRYHGPLASQEGLGTQSPGPGLYDVRSGAEKLSPVKRTVRRSLTDFEAADTGVPAARCFVAVVCVQLCTCGPHHGAAVPVEMRSMRPTDKQVKLLGAAPSHGRLTPSLAIELCLCFLLSLQPDISFGSAARGSSSRVYISK